MTPDEKAGWEQRAEQRSRVRREFKVRIAGFARIGRLRNRSNWTASNAPDTGLVYCTTSSEWTRRFAPISRLVTRTATRGARNTEGHSHDEGIHPGSPAVVVIKSPRIDINQSTKSSPRNRVAELITQSSGESIRVCRRSNLRTRTFANCSFDLETAFSRVYLYSLISSRRDRANQV